MQVSLGQNGAPAPVCVAEFKAKVLALVTARSWALGFDSGVFPSSASSPGIMILHDAFPAYVCANPLAFRGLHRHSRGEEDGGYTSCTEGRVRPAGPLLLVMVQGGKEPSVSLGLAVRIHI